MELRGDLTVIASCSKDDRFSRTKAGRYLIKLLCHLTNDLCILHVPEHFNPHGAWLHSNTTHIQSSVSKKDQEGSKVRTSLLTFAAGALDEKIDEVEQRQVPVLLVRLDPVVHHRL